MFKVGDGDLVKFKEQYGTSKEKNLLMLVTKIEKEFYSKRKADYAHRTDKITMLASNGEIFNEPEQCLEIINET